MNLHFIKYIIYENDDDIQPISNFYSPLRSYSITYHLLIPILNK